MIKETLKSIDNENSFTNTITISIDKNNLNLISNLNYISFIEPIDPPNSRNWKITQEEPYIVQI